MANPLLMAEIFDNINEGIYILNRKGDYIYCNNAFLKMVGATREEALSLNAFQLIPEGQVWFRGCGGRHIAQDRNCPVGAGLRARPPVFPSGN